MDNKFVFLENKSIAKEYFSRLEEECDIYNISSNNTGTIRGKKMMITAILAGSSLVVNANDINKYHVCNSLNYPTSQIEDSKVLNDNIDRYINNIKELNNYKTKSELIENILSFKTLNNNWDGMGAYPLEIKSCVNSLLLLDFIGDNLFGTVKDYYPNPNGTITFEWSNNQDEEIFLEVGNNTFSYYVSLNSFETKYYNDQTINEENSKVLSTFIKSI